MTIETILLLLLSIPLGYLTYYIHQKGKNQANKEDVEALTNIVEDIKHSNAKELEELKQKYYVASEREKQYYEEERKVIIDYYIFFNNCISNIIDNLDGVIITHKDGLQLLWSNYLELNVFSQKIDLLVRDDDIVYLSGDLNSLYNDIYSLLKKGYKEAKENGKYDAEMYENKLNPISKKIGDKMREYKDASKQYLSSPQQ
ncbi:MAG: hypothetical protein N4A71_00375 [Carboxylicivirga sp.]|jgi:hypothetical protein|nr:hypothetical protein [Carboxylicivirga sp.]